MWGDPTKQQHDQGDRVTCEELQHHVVILRPVESMRVKDEYKDAIKVNIVDLSDSNKMYRGVLFFNRLIGTFKHSLGTPFFGYIGKERTPSGYMGWAFISMAGDAEWEPVAQAWADANSDFFTEALPEKREGRDLSHHEQGPAPDWAGPVAPPAPARPAPPAPRPAPPAPAARPVSTPPAPAPLSGGSVLERLSRAAQQPAPGARANQTSGNDQEPPY